MEYKSGRYWTSARSHSGIPYNNIMSWWNFFVKYCKQNLHMVFYIYYFQLMYKKELASHFDAGVAIDSVFFENCDLPQPPDEGISCSENEWQCLNNVSLHS